MSEIPKSDGESPFKELAEVIARVGVGMVAYRDFIGRKKAGLIIDELGFKVAGDDELRGLLTDVFGTCVATGMVLAATKQTDEQSVDDNVDRLTIELPASLRELSRFMPYMIVQGMEFQQESAAGHHQDMLFQWRNEFELLQSAE